VTAATGWEEFYVSVQFCGTLRRLGNALLSWDDLALKSDSSKMTQVADILVKNCCGVVFGVSFNSWSFSHSDVPGKLAVNS